MNVFESIRKSLSEQLDVPMEQITEDSDILNDLEADSLDLVDMVMNLEDEFGIEIPDEAFEELKTVGDVVRFVKENAEDVE